jgi:hypothetical protein
MSAAKLAARVRTEIDILKKRPEFAEWLTQQSLENGDLVVVNNSFVFRDKKLIKTRKNARFLALVVAGGKLGPGVFVTSPGDFDTNFKLLKATSASLPSTKSLEVALKDELAAFGKLSFVLIGEIRDEAQTVEIKHTYAKELRFEPGAGEPSVTERGDQRAVIVADLSDPETLWDTIQLTVNADLGAGAEGFKSALSAAFDELHDTAVSTLHLPRGSRSGSDSSFLARLAASIAESRAQYEKSIQRYESKEGALHLNDALRIAYNFADDAIKVLQLLVSLADLKTIILWSTISAHYELASAFHALPWAKARRKKPSLELYQQIVGGARNRAFHNLLSFDRPIESDLEGVSVQARTLTILSTHGKRNRVPFDYQDRELIEVLGELTLAPETKVSLNFWKRNATVMKAFEALLIKTEAALWEVHKRFHRRSELFAPLTISKMLKRPRTITIHVTRSVGKIVRSVTDV